MKTLIVILFLLPFTAWADDSLYAGLAVFDGDPSASVAYERQYRLSDQLSWQAEAGLFGANDESAGYLTAGLKYSFDRLSVGLSVGVLNALFDEQAYAPPTSYIDPVTGDHVMPAHQTVIYPDGRVIVTDGSKYVTEYERGWSKLAIARVTYDLTQAWGVSVAYTTSDTSDDATFVQARWAF